MTNSFHSHEGPDNEENTLTNALIANSQNQTNQKQNKLTNKIYQMLYNIKIVEFAVIAILSEILANRVVHIGSALISILNKTKKAQKIFSSKNIQKLIAFKRPSKGAAIAAKEILAFTMALGLMKFVSKEAQHYADKEMDCLEKKDKQH